jgi:protein-disulfide isomerase
MAEEKDREQLQKERLQQEAEWAAADRRRRLVKFGSLAVFVATIIVVLLVSQSGGGDNGGSGTVPAPTGTINALLAGIPQSGPVLGDPNATSTLVEYGDLQCPICKEYSETVIPALISGPVKEGKFKLEYRNFTIIPPLSQSVAAGAAALAAGEQGKFWNYLELFYRNQGAEGSGYVTDGFLNQVAKVAGVPDIAKWNTDRKSSRLISEVKRTTADANKAGYSGTPTFVAEGPGGSKVLGTPSNTSIDPFVAGIAAVK